MEVRTDQYDPSVTDDEKTMFGTKDIRLEEELLGFDRDDTEEFDYMIPDDVLNVEDTVYKNYSGSKSGQRQSRVASVLKSYFPYIGGVSYSRVSATKFRRETRRNVGTELESTDVEFISVGDLPSKIKRLIGYSNRKSEGL